MGHKGNRCQTKYGAATWRTTRRWRRSAVSDCFSSYLLLCWPILCATILVNHESYKCWAIDHCQ